MEYNCNDCKKTYSSYQSLWIHNKKFHRIQLPKSSEGSKTSSENILKPSNMAVKRSDKVLMDSESVISETEQLKEYNCRNCNKIFYNVKTRWSHEKICKTKINLLEENNKLKIENEKLKMQIIPMNSTVTNTNSNNSQINNGTINNHQTNTQNNNINNNNINNNVTINQLGTEKINYRTKDIRRIARDGLNGAITCVQKTNFNKDKPENHIFCSSSLDGQYCTTINHKTQKPEKIAKKELFWKVLESSFKIIEGIALQIECNSELREQIPVNEQAKLYDIIENKSKFYEKKNWKTFYNSINSMSYNYKDLILSTWSMLKAPTIIEESDSDFDSDSEPDIKEVTEFHDSDSDDDFNLLTAI
jgi:DNA-directed RNA polymerase subunit RPC12/RpoP